LSKRVCYELFYFPYIPDSLIHPTHINAPQKLFGYHTFYDFAATFINMVFDYETVYFDYRGRTWLIELWKGQYSINSGCKLGVYYADQINLVKWCIQEKSSGPLNVYSAKCPPIFPLYITREVLHSDTLSEIPQSTSS